VTLLTAVGRLDEALSESDAILQASDDALPRLHAERGSLLVHLDRFDDATAEAETALALAGDDDGARALAYRALATVAQAKADVPACFDWFERQLAIARNLGPAARLSALTNHVMHLAIFGFVPEATATLAEADAMRDSLGGAALRDALDVSFVLAKWQAGHWDDALERVRWIAIPPQPPEAWVVLAHCAAIAIEAARGNAAEVKRLVPEIAEASIGRANAAWARAVAHAMIGEIDAAVDVLERTWSHNRQCGRLVDAHHLLGDLAELELERGNAAAAHAHAMELDEACAGSGIPAAVTVRDRIVAMVTGETERALNALAVAEEHALLPHVASCAFRPGLPGLRARRAPALGIRHLPGSRRGDTAAPGGARDEGSRDGGAAPATRRQGCADRYRAEVEPTRARRAHEPRDRERIDGEPEDRRGLPLASVCEDRVCVADRAGGGRE
jgi:tetratricopeptide (TPR) repeat protein